MTKMREIQNKVICQLLALAKQGYDIDLPHIIGFYADRG